MESIISTAKIETLKRKSNDFHIPNGMNVYRTGDKILIKFESSKKIIVMIIVMIDALM